MPKPATLTHPYRLTIDLQVLRHLGVGLYSNIPAVISEVVANSYDADADNVWIDVDDSTHTITIRDDGCGMTRDEINHKYLKVGYDKRGNEPALTLKHNRQPMGRKGIGKLSLFSIAKIVEVHSVKKGTHGEIVSKCGFIMNADDIEKRIRDPKAASEYYPVPVEESKITITEGTCIFVRNFHKGWRNTENYVRRRVARRFSVIGSEYRFTVIVDGEPLTLEDRDYFDSMEYVWAIGNGAESKRFLDACTKARRKGTLPGLINKDADKPVSGWIGTVFEHKDLGEDDNAVSILMRGKIAHENVLKEIKEGRFFKEYLIGEIRADWLDTNEEHDIATSSRQSLQEDDPRFRDVKIYVKESLNHIANNWSTWRNENSLAQTTIEYPKIKQWMEALPPDHQNAAKSLIQKIGTIPTKTVGDKREMLRHAILAFETLAYKKNLDALTSFQDFGDFEKLKAIFTSINEVEESYYYQIVKGRLAVLEKLQHITDTSARERFAQEHVFDNLWLLDPSWERADADARMEETVLKAFGKIEAGLTQEEKDGRLDIRYRTAAGRHIIIELKKSDRLVSAHELAAQVGKYRSALEKALKKSDPDKHHDIDIICLLGMPPSPPIERDRAEKLLRAESARFLTYEELITQTRRSYRDYLDAQTKIGKIQSLVEEI